MKIKDWYVSVSLEVYGSVVRTVSARGNTLEAARENLHKEIDALLEEQHVERSVLLAAKESL